MSERTTSLLRPRAAQGGPGHARHSHPVGRRLVIGAVAAAGLSLSAGNALAMAQERSVPDLVVQLRAADPLVRARAACDLRELGDRAADAIAPLAALLDDPTPLKSDVCEKNRDWGGRDGDVTTPGKQAAAALVAIGSRSVTPLLGALQSPVWVARRNAVWALGALHDARAVPPVVEALKDREAPVREQASWALGALHDRAAVPALVKALEDADTRVRRQTAWALGALRDPRAAEPLAAALKDQDASVREQAAWAAGALRDRTAVPPLIALLTDREVGVRRQAAWALGALGDARALEPLLTALKDSDPSVRRQVAWAIGVVNK